jgi:hypothetical protein
VVSDRFPEVSRVEHPAKKTKPKDRYKVFLNVFTPMDSIDEIKIL